MNKSHAQQHLVHLADTAPDDSLSLVIVQTYLITITIAIAGRSVGP